MGHDTVNMEALVGFSNFQPTACVANEIQMPWLMSPSRIMHRREGLDIRNAPSDRISRAGMYWVM